MSNQGIDAGKEPITSDKGVESEARAARVIAELERLIRDAEVTDPEEVGNALAWARARVDDPSCDPPHWRRR